MTEPHASVVRQSGRDGRPPPYLGDETSGRDDAALETASACRFTCRSVRSRVECLYGHRDDGRSTGWPPSCGGSGTDRLFMGIRVRDMRGMKGGRRCQRLGRQQVMRIAGLYVRSTGSTGLEPATSGVTGRVGHSDARRRTSRNGLICRYFLPVRSPLRMVEPILGSTFGPRVGHEMLSIRTADRH